MADESISLELFIEADKANLTLGELEQGFDAMKKRLGDVGRGSEEFKKLTTAMAQTGGEIKNIELGFESLDSEGVATEIGSVAGAVGDITAAFILMGGESDTMKEMAANIQTAMAVSMGFKGAIEGVSSANKLYENVLKKGIKSTKLWSIATKIAGVAQGIFNAIMNLNPISIIVLAISGLIVGLVALTGTIGDVIDFALKPFQKAIDTVVDALQWLGIMESDSAIATRKAEEAKADAAVKSATTRRKEIESLTKAHKKASDKMIEDLNFEIRMRKANGEDTTKIELKKLEDLIRIAEAQKKLHEETLVRLEEEFNARVKAGQIGVTTVQNYLKAKMESTQAIIDNNAAQLQSEQDLQVGIAEAKTEERTKWKEGEAERAFLKRQQEQADKDARMEMIDFDTEADLTLKTGQLDRQSIHIEGLISNEHLLENEKIRFHEAEKARKKAEFDAAVKQGQAQAQNAANIAQSLISLNNAVLDNQLTGDKLSEKEKLKAQKKHFERSKKLNIAMAAINGAQAVLAALTIPPPLGFILAGLAGVTAGVQIAAISKQQFNGGSTTPRVPLPPPADLSAGAGSGGGGAQINPVSNTSTVLGNQTIQVVETDITETQNNVNVIEESATF